MANFCKVTWSSGLLLASTLGQKYITQIGNPKHNRSHAKAHLKLEHSHRVLIAENQLDVGVFFAINLWIWCRFENDRFVHFLIFITWFLSLCHINYIMKMIISDSISDLDLGDCFINGLNLSLSFQRFRNDRLSILNYFSTFMYRHHRKSLQRIEWKLKFVEKLNK